jgi:hypothetical protein
MAAHLGKDKAFTVTGKDVITNHPQDHDLSLVPVLEVVVGLMGVDSLRWASTN